MQKNDFLSATQLAKNTSATINSLESGGSDKLIILKNNSPKAVLMSFEAYSAMEEELEDLRLTALALLRQQSLDPKETITHKEMVKKYMV